MFTSFTKCITNFLMFIILVCTMSPITIARATSAHDQSGIGSGPQVIPASAFDESLPLSSIIPIPSTTAAMMLRNHPVAPKTLTRAGNNLTDPSIVQTSPEGKSTSQAMAAPVTSFDGIGATGYWPPDANGDVGYSSVTGRKYYMQAVNTSFRIWDVTNPAAVTSLYGPALGNTLWSGFGGLCETHNDGDSIILFDHLANRWMFSQFAIKFPNDFHQCIAVSASADPTSTWYRYDFPYSTTKLNDYAKFGVWPDGYYMSVNQFDGNTDAWRGAGAVVFNRSAMLNGLPATMIKFDIGQVYLGYGLMLPSDLDGPAPAAGSPNYFLEWDDSAWQNDPTDTLRIWNFHVDWAIPANSTFGANGSFDPNAKVATANLDFNMCNNARNCIAQPGTAQKLDAIAYGQLMYRLQYRNFGSYQTLVGNQTVDATGTDKAGVYWFELRNSGFGWGMNQQGVYAPDADNRWMGSTAMDQSGNMALGYSVSSTSTYPSVRYTGRLVSDSLGTLPQGESSFVTGSGSQTGTNRWGDYSMMTVDPTDDCTFWYTQEYYSTTSFSGWKTRIGSFQFPSCARAISGNAGAAGLTLSYTDGTPKTVTSQTDGSYSFQISAGWSGTVTPSHPCFTFSPTSINYSNVTANQITQNYVPTFNPASGCGDINVLIGGVNKGRYGLPAASSIRDKYGSVNSGPINISSSNSVPIVASQRVLYGNSYSEMMGLPLEQLSHEYWFPYYNNVAMDSQLRVSNLGGGTTTIKVYLGTQQIDSYSLAAGGATRKNYAGKNGGPLRVTSSATNILSTIRVLFGGSSLSELMGLPLEQLTDEYLFPYYNNVAMDSQLRVSNVGGAPTTIKVYLGTQQIDSYSLATGGATRKNYPNKNGGPLRVTSSASNILSTIRVLYGGTSLSELMGFPANQLDQEYWYPVYDNSSLDSQLRVSNVGAGTTTITVYAGGDLIDSYSLAAGAATRKNYGQNTGPLHVVSSSEPILTTIRLLYNTSLYEMTGLPDSQLSTQYFFPWYNNSAMNSELRFAVP